jgi:di/tricarboxylate transporter
LAILTALGIVPVNNAFSGFSSPAVVTMICTFFLGAALANTGVADRLGGYINSFAGSSETTSVAAVMVVAATLSAVMNNIAATVILLPTVTIVSQRSGVSLSRLMIPLAFGTVLGGTTTIIGTAPNIIVSDLLAEYGLRRFDFLDFTACGLALAVIGISYVSFFGRRHLPKESGARHAIRKKENLQQLYELKERLFSLRIPDDASIDGMSLGELQVGGVLGVQIIAIQRGESRIISPQASDRVEVGDLLIARGRLSEIEQLVRFKGVELLESGEVELSELDVYFVQITVSEQLAGKSLRQHNFTESFQVAGVSVERDERLIEKGVSQVILRAGDQLTICGSRSALENFSMHFSYDVELMPLSSQAIAKKTFWLQLPDITRLGNATLAEVRLGELTGHTVVGIYRNSELKLNPTADQKLLGGDLLLVSGSVSAFRRLIELSQLEVGAEIAEPSLESQNYALIEALIAPRSRLIGRSIKDMSFREKYGFLVLAIWREGRPYRARLSDFKLKFGDALLLQGPRSKVSILADNPNFVTLADTKRTVPQRNRAWVALTGVFLMVLLSVFRLQPVHLAAFIGAVFVTLLGAITMERAYRQIEWRVVLLVGALIPIGVAIENTGFASLAAGVAASSVGDYGAHAVLLALVLISSAISQSLDGSLAVILLAPVGVQIANQLGVSPYPFVMALTLAASVAFLTPFSHKANLLVMGVGGYKVKDYFKIGLPMTILIFITLVLVVPIVFPF